jgi:hypothetical protein
MIKDEMRNIIEGNVPENELTEFVFSRSDLKKITWIEKNEFIYDEYFFDVIKIENINLDSIHIVCIDDIGEKNLNEQLKKIVDTSEKSRKNKELLLNKSLIKEYIPAESSVLRDYHKIVCSFPEMNDNYISIIPDHPNPPPESC